MALLLDGVLALGQRVPQLGKEGLRFRVQTASLRMAGTLMVLSLEADTICLLSAEKATERTSLEWSSNLSSSVES